MGSPLGESGRDAKETQHKVTLTKAFEMQLTTVTQVQWSLVMGENPSNFKSGGKLIPINGKSIAMNPNRPVEQVSWEDVQVYITRLNQLDPNHTYRLPTEAEWEYAARAGKSTAYSFGDDPSDLGEYAWYGYNSDHQTHDVAQLLPNPSGLYDMHGNVWEWAYDGNNSSQPNHMIRGGGWSSGTKLLRSARRIQNVLSSESIGFRLVRTAK